MNGKILITGATGTIGKALVAQLRQTNADFLAAGRDATKTAAALNVRANQAVQFDFADPATFAAATAGVDRAFLLGPPLFYDLDKLLGPFIDFLQAAGIRRVVYLSALNAEKMGADLSFHTNVENKLQQDGFELTILKPSFFAQNFKNYEWDNITRHNITYVPAGDGVVAFVDVHDIAAVAAKVLTEEGHGGKTYNITGPEALSYADAAGLLSEVTGRSIAYPAPTPQQYTDTLKQAGAPDFIAPYMISVYGIIAKHQAGQVSNDVEQVTGKKPAALKQVLEEDFNG